MRRSAKKTAFVFAICGESQVSRLKIALRFLRHFSQSDIIVVKHRVTSTLECDEEREPDVPSHLDDRQAAIFLKTTLHRLFPNDERRFCYLDSDVVAVSHRVDEIFKESCSPVAFALDHCHLRQFSPYAVNCSCLDKDCNHLHQALQDKFKVTVKDERWQHWNGGVFLFDQHSHAFLERWHQNTLAIFTDAYWKTRDQGTLIATVFQMGLQNLPTLPAKYNFIVDPLTGRSSHGRRGLEVSEYKVNESYSLKGNSGKPNPCFLHFINDSIGKRGWKNWDDAEKFLEAEQSTAPTKSKKRICIVTPEIMGATKNGGIGTFCYELALLLKEQYEITVLFTARLTDELKAKAAVERFRRLGIRFVPLNEKPVPYRQHGAEWFVSRSLQVLNFFDQEPRFDIIQFQDYEANGFIPIQSKKAGVAFQDTLLTVTMHSNNQWIREAQQQFAPMPAVDVKLGYCEQYCCEHADAVLSPSQHMVDWAKENNWKLATRCRVLPYPLGAQPKLTPSKAIDFSHLIFFGRLEARKGLELFCQSMQIVLDRQNHGLKTISFLGRPGFLSSGEMSDKYLAEFSDRLRKDGIHVVIKSDLDSVEANHYISSTGGIVFIPSLIDNYPYAVLECVHNSFPLFASRTGGIPEILGDANLFEVNKGSLALAILERETRLHKIETRYDASTACRQWLEFHATCPTGEFVSTQASSDDTVSICITHYNHGKYLPDLLRSVAHNDEQPDELLIIDDGSTCEDSKKIFLEEKGKYPHWKFMERSTSAGANAARNEVAQGATSKYLLFMDSDNLACANMIPCFKKAMVHSGADVVTCHHTAFGDDRAPFGRIQPLSSYHPIGAALESGLLENVYGDANFMIKKEVFAKVGGFNPDRALACSDWELLARLCLEGYKLQVVPYTLYYYRYLPESWLRTSNDYYNRSVLLKTYQKHWSKLNSKTLLMDLVVSPNAIIGYPKPKVRRRVKKATFLREMERRIRKVRKGFFAQFSRHSE